jgi:hypothetical protein
MSRMVRQEGRDFAVGSAGNMLLTLGKCDVLGWVRKTVAASRMKKKDKNGKMNEGKSLTEAVKEKKRTEAPVKEVQGKRVEKMRKKEAVAPSSAGGIQTAAVQRPRFRYINRRSARITLRMQLCWLAQYLFVMAPLMYGVEVLMPHEAYTTNTCLFCHKYSKNAKFYGRFRECQEPGCPSKGQRVHREFVSGVNQIAAAYCQMMYVQMDGG